MGDDENVGNVEAASLEKGENVANDGADIGLQVHSAIASIHPGWPPHLDREKAKGAQQSARVVDWKNGRYRIPPLLPIADKFRATRNC
jgi:hypothetical protein